MNALLDNTVLSNFAVIQRADLIKHVLAADAATTRAVLEEHAVGVETGRLPACDWSRLAVLDVTDTAKHLYRQLRVHLGRGEAACLAVARTEGHRVFTDDRDARRFAMQLQVPISGTLGILVLAVDKGILTLEEGDHYLGHMIEAGYRAPFATLVTLLR